jgi:hypothetical protein
MLHPSCCRSIGNYKVNFNKLNDTFFFGQELAKGGKNLGGDKIVYL